MTDINNLLEIMAALRDPKTGCEWDRAQDFDSIAPYTIEEAYEVADSIRRRDWAGLCDELGDLLLQVVYHARMAEELDRFAFQDVVTAICEKMVRRHPHVFGDPSVTGAGTDQGMPLEWERRKLTENADSAHQALLSDIPLALPALSAAAKSGRRASAVGFDWQAKTQVLDKIREELAELEAAVAEEDSTSVREELGDLLFTVANLSRHLCVDPEAALRAANDKFARRFHALQDAVDRGEKGWADWTAADLEAEWGRIKADEARQS